MIVVTGGAGFIGSCIVARLNEMGREDILVVDHIENSHLKKKNLENKRYRYYLDKKDFLRAVLNEELDPNMTIIIHMGACSSTTLTDAQYYQENNFEYTRYVAQWALTHHARFIYASSAATYGDGRFGYKDDDVTTRKLQPLNLYGESKQNFDLWALDNEVTQRMVGLKFFNVFGPNEYHKGDMRSVVAKTYGKVVEEGKIRLFKSYKKEYTDGDQQRDFIYVKDAVDVVMHFFEHPEIGGIFNVGTGQARSWNDVANALFRAIGKKPVIEYFDMPEAMKSKYQYFTQADMGKLRASGYRKNFTALEDSIADYCRYLKDQTHI